MAIPSDLEWPEPRKATGEAREFNKRTGDRGVLLRHVDGLRRPPLWVYEDIEAAIAAVNAGDPSAVIDTGEGKMVAEDLMSIWEIDDRILGAYNRPIDDEAYDGPCS